MEAEKLICALYRRGYRASVEGGRLELRGPRKLSASVRATVCEHKDELVRLVEGKIVVDEREVSEMAHAHFGEIAPEHRQDAPYPPSEKGTDPLAHRHTDKAQFFRGVRGRDLRRRERDGLPPWIRQVDGGGDAA